jgi:Vitamin K-dependent gamma-carboxylase
VTGPAALQRFERFLFYRESDRWISILRIGLGLQVICLCLALRTDWIYLLSSDGHGLISRDLMEATLNADSYLIPRLGWLVKAGSVLGVSELTALWSVWVSLVVAGCMILAGFLSRISAIVAWFLFLCVVKSVGYFSYGVDNLTIIGLFYLMLVPAGDSWSLDSTVWRHSRDSDRVSFFRRVLQIHLCFIYFFSGFSKLAGTGWWNGISLWRAMTVPPFHFLDPEFVLHWKLVLPAAGLLFCALEFFYPVFIWPRMTRNLWLISICVMHLMIGLTMGMFLFAFVMIVFNVAAFGPVGPACLDLVSQDQC